MKFSGMRLTSGQHYATSLCKADYQIRW